MSSLIVSGGTKLQGEVTPSGNKNSVLPMLCAALLTEETVTLHNVPDIIDVQKLTAVFADMGVEINWDKQAQSLSLNSSGLNLDSFNGNLPLGMRASILTFAPLLARFGELNLDLQIGGCSLGIRDIDPHMYLLKQLGTEIRKDNGHVYMHLPGGKFTASNMWPDYASVTGTENAIMAAVLAEGTTVITNAAAEPHVQNLCHLLENMGATIEGIGSNQLTIHGVEKLHGATADVWSDHHEVTTFLAVGAMTGGEVKVHKALPQHFTLIANQFKKLGVSIEFTGDTAVVKEEQSFEPEKPFTSNYIPRIEAAPWPYFPADLLPLMIALSLQTNGVTRFWNKVYEGGLFWTTELLKFNAKLEISDPHRVLIIGPTELKSATIECPYIIRATVALIMTAMATEGRSVLKNVDTVERAHPGFFDKLRALGANLEEVE